MSHPDQLPDLFVDQSLGRIQVPALLRRAGLRLVTLAEHYGVPADQEVADRTWLEDAGKRGWVVLMKDEQVRRNPAERRAIERNAVRCFCLTRQDLTAVEMAERFLHNLDAITAACAEPGPFIYAVYQRRILRLAL